MIDKQNYLTYTDNTSDNNDKTVENLLIIDGVDVSGCEYYFDEKCRCMDASIMQDFYSYPQCNSNPNCYYKLYKRKEQECESLRNLLVEQNDVMRTNELMMKEFGIEILRDITTGDITVRSIKLIELKQKCEELNKEIHNLNSTINFIKVTEHSAINKYNKLKQTLTEIKEIAEFYANSTVGDKQEDGTFKVDLEQCTKLGTVYYTYDPRPANQILQKISEVINEKV